MERASTLSAGNKFGFDLCRPSLKYHTSVKGSTGLAGLVSVIKGSPYHKIRYDFRAVSCTSFILAWILCFICVIKKIPLFKKNGIKSCLDFLLRSFDFLPCVSFSITFMLSFLFGYSLDVVVVVPVLVLMVYACLCAW